MEKLIELLNQFEDTDNWENGYQVKFRESKIISKKFGFIQRLVENDKIDQHKFYDKNILKGFMTLTKEEKADSIIMNLSIQDDPIEFLVSMLK